MDSRHRSEAHGGRFAKVVTPAAKRDAVAHLRKAHRVSELRACSVLGLSTSSLGAVKPEEQRQRKTSCRRGAPSGQGEPDSEDDEVQPEVEVLALLSGEERVVVHAGTEDPRP